MMGQGVTLTKAQVAVIWSPQWTNTPEAQAFGRITRIGQDRETTCIRLLASGTIDKHVNDMQQQRKGLDIRVLGVRVEGKESLTDKEALAALDEIGDGDTHIEKHGLGVATKSTPVAKTKSGMEENREEDEEEHKQEQSKADQGEEGKHLIVEEGEKENGDKERDNES